MASATNSQTTTLHHGQLIQFNSTLFKYVKFWNNENFEWSQKVFLVRKHCSILRTYSVYAEHRNYKIYGDSIPKNYGIPNKKSKEFKICVRNKITVTGWRIHVRTGFIHINKQYYSEKNNSIHIVYLCIFQRKDLLVYYMVYKPCRNTKI